MNSTLDGMVELIDIWFLILEKSLCYSPIDFSCNLICKSWNEICEKINRANADKSNNKQYLKRLSLMYAKRKDRDMFFTSIRRLEHINSGYLWTCLCIIGRHWTDCLDSAILEFAFTKTFLQDRKLKVHFLDEKYYASITTDILHLNPNTLDREEFCECVNHLIDFCCITKFIHLIPNRANQMMWWILNIYSIDQWRTLDTKSLVNQMFIKRPQLCLFQRFLTSVFCVSMMERDLGLMQDILVNTPKSLKMPDKSFYPSHLKWEIMDSTNAEYGIRFIMIYDLNKLEVGSAICILIDALLMFLVFLHCGEADAADLLKKFWYHCAQFQSMRSVLLKKLFSINKTAKKDHTIKWVEETVDKIEWKQGLKELFQDLTAKEEEVFAFYANIYKSDWYVHGCKTRSWKLAFQLINTSDELFDFVKENNSDPNFLQIQMPFYMRKGYIPYSIVKAALQTCKDPTIKWKLDVAANTFRSSEKLKKQSRKRKYTTCVPSWKSSDKYNDVKDLMEGDGKEFAMETKGIE